MQKLSPRLWFTLILVGLMGQFAWTIENMYLNVFLYNTISTDPGYIAAMVAWSAVAATVTTLLMGVASDRLGRRKPFICGGYLLWGVSTAAFGFITVENAAHLFPAASAAAAAAILVILLDCVMTFFGSTANDAAFNAYVTDQIPDDRRGRVESVLAVLPLVSMLIIFGLFDGMTQAGRWKKFFLIFGGLVTLTGLIACFLLPEAPVAKKKEPFWRQLAYGFRPSVIQSHGALYLSLGAMCIFSIAVQVFFPYLIIYMQHYLQMDNYAIVLGVVLVAASVVSVLGGKWIDKWGACRFAFPAGVLMLLGLLAMYFARGMAFVMAAGSVMMSGYMLLTAALTAQIRTLTPPDKAGHFQGIRMIFGVMLPMIIGPAIGAAVIRGNAQTYVELGQVKTVPTPGIFLAAGAVLLLLIVPVTLLRRKEV
ncbi:MAG: MFS transporter [Clostridiales bacterium]|nr:MFS transporter [Clostridiales bacterium]